MAILKSSPGAYLAIVATRYGRTNIQDWNLAMIYLRNAAHKSIGGDSPFRRLLRRMSATSMHRQADIIVNSLSERGMQDLGISAGGLHLIACGAR